MHHIIKDTVYSESNAKFFFVWFNVNVGSASAQRIDQEDIDKPHDRSVFAHFGESREIDLFVVFDYLDILAGTGFEIDAIQRNQIRVSDTPITIGNLGAFQRQFISRNRRQLYLS